MGKLDGKVAVVTGGTSGMALAQQVVCRRGRVRVHHRAEARESG